MLTLSPIELTRCTHHEYLSPLLVHTALSTIDCCGLTCFLDVWSLRVHAEQAVTLPLQLPGPTALCPTLGMLSRSHLAEALHPAARPAQNRWRYMLMEAEPCDLLPVALIGRAVTG